MSPRRRDVLTPLPFLLLASAVGVALGALLTLDLAPLPDVRTALPLPGEIGTWGGPWSARAVMPDEARAAGLERLSGLVGLVGAAAVLAALGAAATVLGTGATARGREVAVRAAVGAGPWRLRALLLRDHALLLALGLGGGALLGVGIAFSARRGWPGGAGAPFDATLPLVALGVVGAIALLVALAPARWARAARLPALLAGGRATATGQEVGARRLLVVLQIAGALAVPVPALLLLQPPPGTAGGAPPPDLVLASVTAPPAGWAALLERLEAERTLTAESIASPGAWEALGPADLVLTECRCVRGTMYLPFAGARARHHAVTARFFAAAGLDVVEGQTFVAAGGASGEPVAVVSRAFARASFDGSPVGRWIRVGREGGVFHRVVGVVEDRAAPGLAAGSGGAVYLSLLQHPLTRAVAAVRSTTPERPDLAAAALRDAADAAGAVVTGEPRSWTSAEHARLVPLRWMGWATTALASLALLSALAGVHTVSRRDAALRRRELGVRRALGASDAGLGRWLATRRVRELAWGALVGLWAAISIAALLREAAVLPGPVRVAPFAWTLAAVAALTLLGSVRGVRDALRVPPAAALAGEDG